MAYGWSIILMLLHTFSIHPIVLNTTSLVYTERICSNLLEHSFGLKEKLTGF